MDGTEDFIALQRDISTINNWIKENHLTFNVAKCKYMLISHKRQPQPMPDLFLDNVSLERVQYFKYLGILLAADLSWTHHIEAVCSKASKLWDYSTVDSMHMQIHQPSLVRPHLEYGCHIMGPQSTEG